MEGPRWARPPLGATTRYVAPTMGVVAWGGPPGSLQVSLCPFFRGKIYFEFSGIFRETLFLANFHGMKIVFLVETVFSEEAKENQKPNYKSSKKLKQANN